MAIEKPRRPKLLPPPPGEAWRPKHTAKKKPFGLVVYRAAGMWLRTHGRDYYEWVSWHATERARNDAIEHANRDMDRKYGPTIALGKISR